MFVTQPLLSRKKSLVTAVPVSRMAFLRLKLKAASSSSTGRLEHL